MRPALFAVALAASTLALPARALGAQEIPLDPKVPMITTSGSGEIRRAPDYVEIEVGLQTRGSTPGGAAAEIERLLAVVRDSLRARRVPDSALVVGTRSILPAQNFPDRSITGYGANLAFTVKLREIPQLGGVLDALAGAGATQVSGVRYRIDDEDGAYAEAVAKAIAEATHDALASARAAGGRLGGLVYLDVSRNDRPLLGYHGYFPGITGDRQGQEAVSGATVTIHWRFEGR